MARDRFHAARKGGLPVHRDHGRGRGKDADREPGGSYWGGAWVFASEAAAGIEYRFRGLAVSASVCFAYRSEPPERIWYAEPEAAMSLVTRAGVSWRF